MLPSQANIKTNKANYFRAMTDLRHRKSGLIWLAHKINPIDLLLPKRKAGFYNKMYFETPIIMVIIVCLNLEKVPT